jgi:hypothetical protein
MPSRQPRPSRKTILTGRQRIGNVNVSTAGVVQSIIALTLPGWGDRPAAVGAAFLRFRYRRLKFTFRSAAGSSGTVFPTVDTVAPGIGNLVMGVADDDTLSASTADDVLNLRTSREFQVFRDCSITWRPVDRSKWYYINADPTTSDARLTTPGTFLLVSDIPLQLAATAGSPTTWNCGTLDLEYDIEFDGATLVPV